MSEGPELRPEIADHYDAYDEHRRFDNALGSIEQERHRQVLGRHLPAPPARILDVGGGPGAFSHWLAAAGYEVHLIDPVPRHVEQALAGADNRHPLGSATVGDARRLDFPDASFAAVLALGPLYHLTDRSDRLLALTEALRVLEPGGAVFAAAISRFGSALDGLHSGFVDDPDFRKIIERDLEEGQHATPPATSATSPRPSSITPMSCAPRLAKPVSPTSRFWPPRASPGWLPIWRTVGPTPKRDKCSWIFWPAWSVSRPFSGSAPTCLPLLIGQKPGIDKTRLKL